MLSKDEVCDKVIGNINNLKLNHNPLMSVISWSICSNFLTVPCFNFKLICFNSKHVFSQASSNNLL